jgi:cytochrome c-type biogenesis protein CcmH/NrfF
MQAPLQWALALVLLLLGVVVLVTALRSRQTEPWHHHR